jgi:hypothetical protein
MVCPSLEPCTAVHENRFHAILHGNELCTEHTGLNCRLSLREPNDRSLVQQDDETSP